MGKSASHDVFICHASADKEVADAVCATLEELDVRCWIAPRDVLPGSVWAEAIHDAVSRSRIMVLVYSGEINRSPHVLRELERATSDGVAILPLRIEDVAPTGAIEYYIGSSHWLDAFTEPLEEHLEKLADAVTTLLQSSGVYPRSRKAEAASTSSASISAVRRAPRKTSSTSISPALLITVAVLGAGAVALGVLLANRGDDRGEPERHVTDTGAEAPEADGSRAEAERLKLQTTDLRRQLATVRTSIDERLAAAAADPNERALLQKIKTAFDAEASELAGIDNRLSAAERFEEREEFSAAAAAYRKAGTKLSGLLEHFHAVEPSARLSDERDRARDAKNGATTWFVQSGIGETEELKRARAEYDRARASEARGDTTAARFSYGEARAAFEAILKDAPQLLLAREAAAKAKHGAQAAESRWRTFARSADADLLAKIPGHEVAKTSLERATRHLDNSDYGAAAREFASASKGYEQALVVAESVRLDRMLETVRKEGLAAKKRYDEFISGKPAFKSTAADIGVKVWGEARQAAAAGDKDAAIKGYSEVKLQFAKALAEVEEEAKRVPKGEEILQRMFKEMRTAEANRIIKTTSGVGVMRLSTGGELTVMSYSKHPNHTVSQMISPMGRLVSGGDGKVFWTWNPITQEVAITKGIERLVLLRESASLFEWKKHYKSVETQGKERIKGRECFKLRMPHKGSDGHDLLFIDTETLRPAQRTIRVRKDGFETYTKTTVGDYRKIGAFYFPFRSEIESPQGSATLVTREFLVNPTLPRDLFVRPPAVIDALEDD